MPEIVSARQAAEYVKSGDTLGVNAFLTQINPISITSAIAQRFLEQGAPGNLTLFCPGSIGDWTEDSHAEDIVRSGAVTKMVSSFFSSAPASARLIKENRAQAYNLPLGVMCHMTRAAASGQKFLFSRIGLNLFVDPVYGGSKLNDSSQEDWVEKLIIDGEEYLKYKVPKIDVAIIMASSADKYGNICFENEAVTLDALSMAQAARCSGGKVLVQVARIREEKLRPWNTIIPAALVDCIVLCPDQQQVTGVNGYDPKLCGEQFVPPEELDGYLKPAGVDLAREIICRRAERELHEGDLVNLGVGIPEGVSPAAAKTGMIKKVTLTVESGAFGGMPSSGHAFGSAVGAMSICSSSQIFDFYDGGGLDIAFIGAMEIDAQGNVNAHSSPAKLSGIGGFANITQTTHRVVFCGTFTSGGLKISEDENGVHILQEGRFSKFVRQVSAVSFSAKNARRNGQEILYVTERCVFRLGDEGLELIEVAKGIDLQRDVFDRLPFEPKLCL